MVNILSSPERLPDILYSNKIKEVLGKKVSVRGINRAIKRYVDRKILIKLKNGVYAKASANQFLVADQVYRGYIGFSSALYLHELKTEIEDLTLVCVGERSKPLTFAGLRLIPIFLPDFFYGTTTMNGVTVSTYAKTLFDMLYKPKYGNFFDFYRAINQRKLNGEEWRELMAYLEKANTTTIRRAGYALEDKAPKWFSEKLSRLSTGKGKSFFVHRKPINFNKSWFIYDDVGVSRWKNAV